MLVCEISYWCDVTTCYTMTYDTIDFDVFYYRKIWLGLSYAKIGMKAKTFESRVFEMEYSSLKTEY